MGYTYNRLCCLLIVSILFIAYSSVGFGLNKQVVISTPEIPTPESHFGFTPGDDRMLFDYEEMITYMKILEVLSPKVKMEQIGVSEMGRSADQTGAHPRTSRSD